MTGWYIISEIDPATFYFPAGYVLAAGATVEVHSGPGARSNPPRALLWSALYIWNDTSDAAALYDSTNRMVSRWAY